MVRGKTQIKRIENAASRQVAFSKRRNGLLKKAFELSVLCDAEVALIVFSPRGKLYEFASSSINKTVERYQKRAKDLGLGSKSQETAQHAKEDTLSLAKKIELLDASKRKLLGDGLELCSIDELQQVENQLERGLIKIRERKNQLFREHIEQLRKQERCLLEENAKLRGKCGLPLPLPSSEQQEVLHGGSVEVETDLFIGPPKR